MSNGKKKIKNKSKKQKVKVKNGQLKEKLYKTKIK